MCTLHRRMIPMKTTGIKYLAAAALVSIFFYVFWKRNRNPFPQFDYFSNVQNYKPYNSFIEHYDVKNVQDAYNKYQKYLDFGMSADNAFKSVIENKFRKND